MTTKRAEKGDLMRIKKSKLVKPIDSSSEQQVNEIIWRRICSYLDVRSILKGISLCSKLLNNVARHPDSWHNVCCEPLKGVISNLHITALSRRWTEVLTLDLTECYDVHDAG
jgi:hypothetical protein